MGISEDNNKIRLKNMAKELKNLTKRSENYSQWFNDLVMKADLAEQSAVRGCMTIKPYGYAIWEKMQHQLDTMFKETGVQNAYFPLLIPKTSSPARPSMSRASPRSVPSSPTTASVPPRTAATSRWTPPPNSRRS